MILREFLYVDTDKVRAMLAQLDGGIAEEERKTNREGNRWTVGQHLQNIDSETHTQKSLGDALFPTLEAALDAEGLIQDISDEVADIDEWMSGRLKQSVPPGSLVRIKAYGSLFDARYVAETFAAFGAVNIGLRAIDKNSALQTSPQTGSKGRQGKQLNRPTVANKSDPQMRQLEDVIPDFQIIGTTEEAANGYYMRAIAQVARGVFAPGLHINLSPVESGEVLISARLQEGRQYLDSETDILFARYGTEQQEWTLVGSLGSYGPTRTDVPEANFLRKDGSVLRGEFANYINAHMRHLGGLGFIDLPQYPGFSVIPFAVYRSIPRYSGEEAARG
ncbi:hypothetical protein ACKI1I_45960 [Streptomyces turgidiscabies]|uniref:DUF6414 family protein n=1 Tax=Streptomyces TaxID=1883 RepID=UPI00076E68C1|nr:MULTISPECIES: hypothetical protein [Streptomyces]MDX3499558.1 hypothetical protein [Streptomyces turgidiscabies]GAQ76494.1 hypothetical protein T45_08289 [Streptomyces turgidiscabies]